MKTFNVVIAAGGHSVRYGKENKLFEPCNSSCVIAEAIGAFLPFREITRIVVAIDTDSSDELLDRLEAAHMDDDRRIVLTRGGNSRTQTVAYGLEATEDDCDFVLIHDGARPFVTREVVERVMQGTEERGACIPVLPLTDNLLAVTVNGAAPLDRNGFRLVQTPMGFARDVILDAYRNRTGDFLDDFGVADSVLHGNVLLVDGDAANRKITVKTDLVPCLVGSGYDIHRLREGDGLPLLGVKISCPYSFVAHSDGDAAIHALMDAILSALGKKDIGHLYPVDDPAYDDADSKDLLRGVLDIMRAENRSVVNCSVTIIAMHPRISPYIDKMRASAAALLGIPAGRVGVAATTNEEVGELGKGDAIAAFATVLLS